MEDRKLEKRRKEERMDETEGEEKTMRKCNSLKEET